MQEAQGFCSLPQQSNKSASIRAGHRYRSPRIPCFCPTVAGRRKPQLCPPAWLKKLSADPASPDLRCTPLHPKATTRRLQRTDEQNKKPDFRAGPARERLWRPRYALSRASEPQRQHGHIATLSRRAKRYHGGPLRRAAQKTIAAPWPSKHNSTPTKGWAASTPRSPKGD